ncbi:hypothetical protein M3Y97_00606500 [Aphelenchoides bicaudatus]|nr:hypothetical protein M3Y97_00606500 [Aphelenchoides bicaudatus]
MFSNLVVFLLVVALPFGQKKVNALEEKGYNPAMDFWRQMSSTMDAKQYKGLRELISQNVDTPKDELETKVGEWSKTSGLEQDFKIFSDIQREYRKAASQYPGTPNSESVNGSENEMTKIISELASINEEQKISFKEACRRQNKLVKAQPPKNIEALGLQNLINPWCEA